MAVSRAPKLGTPRRRLSPAEKRHLVELSLRGGSSIRAVAREQSVSRHTLYLWHTLYRAGKLGAESAPEYAPALLPVTIAAPERSMGRPRDAAATASVVQITLPSGATLRIEGVDVAVCCALLAQLQR